MDAISTLQPKRTPIPAIQGTGAESPLVGRAVRTQGVVTAVLDTPRLQGIFVQDPKGDGNEATSDAVFVKLTQPTTAKVGDAATVVGTVVEDRGMTTIEGTALARGSRRSRVPVVGDDAARKPRAFDVTLPGDATKAARYLEAREGMLGRMDNALVLAPTTNYGLYTVVDGDTHPPAKDYTDSGRRGTHLPVSTDLLGKRQELATGDRVSVVQGPIDYRFGEYRLLQTERDPKVAAGPVAPRVWGDLDGDDQIGDADIAGIAAREGSAASGPLDAADLDGNGAISANDTRIARRRAKLEMADIPTFTIASLNAQNVFDTEDNPLKQDDTPTRQQLDRKLALLARTITHELGSPELLGLQEIENATVLQQLLKRPEMKGKGYDFAIMEGPDFRGINNALLYRKGAGVTVSEVRQAQGTTKLVDGRQPPPSGESPLFARPPLVADVHVSDRTGAHEAGLTVVVNHLMSKYSPEGRPTEPWRLEQAQFLSDLARRLRKEDPRRPVVVMGDMNDTETSKAVRLLSDPQSSVLRNLTIEQVPKGERYSYQYRGESELIDHLLVTPDLAERTARAGVRHIHADRPSGVDSVGQTRLTDHDVPYASFRLEPHAAPRQRAGGREDAA